MLVLPPKPVIWAAQPGSQVLYFSVPYEVREVLFEGTRAGGKTDSQLQDFAREVGTGMGSDWSGYLFKRTNPELRDVKEKIMRFWPRMFPGLSIVKSPYFEVTFPEGEKLMLRHMGREEDYWDVHGSSVTWIGWEELSNWANPKLFLKCNSLLRSSHPVAAFKKRIRATTNPGGPGHNWIKERYCLPTKRNQIIVDTDENMADKWLSPEDQKLLGPEAMEPKMRMAIFSDIRENKVFLDSDPGYLAGLSADAESDEQRRAWVYGDWDIVSGGMFDDVWNRKVHVIKPFKVPASWKIDRAYDWGEAKPFSLGWWAESDGSDVRLASGRMASTVPGDLFLIGEYYGCKKGRPNEGLRMTSTEQAKAFVLREIEMGIHHRCVAGPADTSIFSGHDGKSSIAEEMSRDVQLDDGRIVPGIYFTKARKGPNTRKPGWSHCRKLLKNSIRVDNRPRQNPGVFFFDTNTEFLRCVPPLPRSLKDPDDVDTEAEDHHGDMFRYRAIETGFGLIQGTTTGV